MSRKKRPTTGLSLSAGEKAIIDWCQKTTGLARKPMIMAEMRKACKKLGGDPAAIEKEADQAAEAKA